MTNGIENAFTLDYKTILLGIFAVLFIVKQIIEIFAYYKKKFRIKTGSSEDREILIKRVEVLEKHDDWQYREISKISQGVEEIKAELLDTKISNMRWEILDFASSLSVGRLPSKEQFDHVITTHGKYEEVLKEHGLTNGLVTSSMEVINEKYKEFLKDGFSESKKMSLLVLNDNKK